MIGFFLLNCVRCTADFMRGIYPPMRNLGITFSCQGSFGTQVSGLLKTRRVASAKPQNTGKRLQPLPRITRRSETAVVIGAASNRLRRP